MKKVLYYIILITFIISGSIRPARAQLTMDGTEFIAKLKEWLQTVSEAQNKVTQQGLQLKLQEAQGFAPNKLEEALTKMWQSALTKSTTFDKVEESSQEKHVQILEEQTEAYQTAVKAEYEEKYNIATEELNREKQRLTEYQSACNAANQKAAQKKQAYEAVRGQPGKEEVAYNEYSVALSEQESTCNTISALQNQINEQEAMISKLKIELRTVGTAQDPKYVEHKTKADMTKENPVDDTLYTAKENGHNFDWAGNIEITNYIPTTEDYESFYKNYFYNPNDPDIDSQNDPKDKVAKAQTLTERVKHERDFLLANTTMHLLQVTASIRREIPVRSQLVKEMYERTKKESGGEYAAINAFAETRIENARALLLYAKLLSAKLQYLAIHSLGNDILLERDNASPDKVKYGEFDMKHYVLTQEYLEQLITESNSPEVPDKLLNVQEENTEWRP